MATMCLQLFDSHMSSSSSCASCARELRRQRGKVAEKTRERSLAGEGTQSGRGRGSGSGSERQRERGREREGERARERERERVQAHPRRAGSSQTHMEIHRYIDMSIDSCM